MGLVRRRRFDFLDDDIDQFSHGASRLAVFETGNGLGQRNGDVLKMKWSDYDGEWLHVEQGKTGAKVNLPVHLLQPLKQVIDIQPKVGPTIFTTPTGKAWNRSNLHRNFNPHRVKTEADDLHWHDLRGTLVSMLGEAGCTEIQIAAITGHFVVNSQVGGYLNMGGNLAIEAYTKLNYMLVQAPTDYLQIRN